MFRNAVASAVVFILCLLNGVSCKKPPLPLPAAAQNVQEATAGTKENPVPQLELEDQILELETIYENDFSRDTGDWLAEGGADVLIRDGRLFMDARKDVHWYLTLWCRKPFEGDTVIEYTARAEEETGSTNINFFVYGSMPDGSSVLDTTSERTGDYGEYHVLNNYIYTFLNNRRENKPEEEILRVRFRKDPGFHLLEEHWGEPLRRGRDYRFSIVIQGPRMRFYVDGKIIFDYEDSANPHRHGHHAFRTWKSFISAGSFRVSRIVSSTGK